MRGENFYVIQTSASFGFVSGGECTKDKVELLNLPALINPAGEYIRMCDRERSAQSRPAGTFQHSIFQVENDLPVLNLSSVVNDRYSLYNLTSS